MVPLTIAVPVPFGARVKLPFEFVMLIVLPSTLTLSTSKSVDTTTVPVPFGVNVRSPFELDVAITLPLILILSTSKSVLITTVPVPLGERLRSPLVLVVIILLPLILTLSTSRSPVILTAPVILAAAPNVNVVPSKVKLPSSSIAPPVPAITTLLFVRSVTFKLLALRSVPS